jgi:hypothetical protein
MVIQGRAVLNLRMPPPPLLEGENSIDIVEIILPKIVVLSILKVEV